MFTSLAKMKTRPGDQILDRSGHHDLAWSGERCDARSDVDGNALHVAVDFLDLPRMEPATDLNAERSNCRGNRASAAHRASRAIESGKKSIAQRFHLVAAGSRKLPPHRGVMHVKQIAPAMVTQLFGSRRRIHDVRKQYSCKKTIALCRRNGSGQELLDQITNLFVDEKQMIGSLDFDQPCAWNVLGKKSSELDRDQRVFRTVNDQGRHLNRGQDIADVNLHGHSYNRHGCRRACTQSLEAAPPLLQSGIVPT